MLCRGCRAVSPWLLLLAGQAAGPATSSPFFSACRLLCARSACSWARRVSSCALLSGPGARPAPPGARGDLLAVEAGVLLPLASAPMTRKPGPAHRCPAGTASPPPSGPTGWTSCPAGAITCHVAPRKRTCAWALTSGRASRRAPLTRRFRRRWNSFRRRGAGSSLPGCVTSRGCRFDVSSGVTWRAFARSMSMRIDVTVAPHQPVGG